MTNILTRLRIQKNFSANEQTAADYILTNPETVTQMNAQALADACFVSVATIYRLCEKTGCSGFSEFKLKILDALRTYRVGDDAFDYDFPIQENVTALEIAESIRTDYSKTVDSTINLLSMDIMEAAAEKMRQAKVIDIYTSAGNLYMAYNFRFQMMEIGQPVNVPVDEYEQRLLAAQSDKTHFAIVISFMGRGALVSNIRKTLYKHKVPTLLICSPSFEEGNIPSDFKLFISPHENHYRKISSFSTRLSVLFLLDLLYTNYFRTNYVENITKKLSYYKDISGGHT